MASGHSLCVSAERFLRVVLFATTPLILSACQAPSSLSVPSGPLNLQQSIKSLSTKNLWTVDPAERTLRRAADAPVPARKAGYKALFQFGGGTAPTDPLSGVFIDHAGRIFGTTAAGGGASAVGAVYELVRSGKGLSEQTLFGFDYSTCATDGCYPQSVPLEDAAGNIYVTASSYDGSRSLGGGSAIKLSPSGSGYVETGLYRFGSGTDGANPFAGFIEQNGTLYTTTSYGGKYGYGAIVSISADTFAEQDVYDFAGAYVDGEYPQSSLVADSSGALYGTTIYGGAYGAGTVFKFVPGASGGGTETTLFSFGGFDNSGRVPTGGVVVDNRGDIYGTTAAGGGAHRYGTVYELKRSRGSYKEKILHAFLDGSDGIDPVGGVTLLNGELYGVTHFAGAAGDCCGTVYEIAPDGTGYQELLDFTHYGGAYPGAYPAGTLFAKGNAIFGTTSGGDIGGSFNGGLLFRLIP